MHALYWLSILVFCEAAIGGMVFGALSVLRYWGQEMRDSERITYKLVFPRELSLDTAALLFTSLTGVFRAPTKLPGLYGTNSIAFEILATPEGLVHLLSFAPDLEDTIRGHLRGVIPTMGFEPVSVHPRRWQYGIELDATRVIDPEKGTPYDPNPDLVGVLLSSFRELRSGEAVLAQFVLAPIHHTVRTADDPAFFAIGRLAASGNDIRSKGLLKRVLSAYSSLEVFSVRLIPSRRLQDVTDRATPVHWPGQLSSKALAIVCGLPIGSPEVPGLKLGGSRRISPDASIPSEGIQLAESNFPGITRPLAVPVSKLMEHAWLAGPTSSGKSTVLHNLAAQVMQQGYGLVLVEPKGDLAQDVLSSVPVERLDDVIWFDPTDIAHPIGLNVLAGPDPERTAGYIVGLMQSHYGDSWGPRLAMILRYSVLTAAMNELTLYDVKQLLINPDFRTRIVKATKDPDVKSFWRRFDTGPDSQIDSVINKLDAFVGSRAIRNIVGQTSGLDIGKVVEEGKILLVPLPEARLGAANSSMLGSMLVAELWQHIRLRPKANRVPIVLVLDEFQNFMNLSTPMEDAFAQARSYGLGLVVANQHTGQLSQSVLAAVLNNARTKMVFGMAHDDARKLKDQFHPLEAYDLQSLGQYEVILQAMTPTGMAPVVTGKTYGPPRPSGFGTQARLLSQVKYGRNASEVEAEMSERHKVAEKPDRPKFGARPKASE